MQKDQEYWDQQLREGHKNRKGTDTGRFDTTGKILGVVQCCADRDLPSHFVFFSSFTLERLFGYTLKCSLHWEEVKL